MTKHISEEKGAEYFMNSLVNNEVIGSSVGPAIEVQRVENGMVLFNTLIGTVHSRI